MSGEGFVTPNVGDFFIPFCLPSSPDHIQAYVEWAVERHPDLSSLTKRVWRRLCWYRGIQEDGECFVSQNTLAEELSSSKSRVKVALQELKTQGFIRIYHRGKTLTNVIKFLWHPCFNEEIQRQKDLTIKRKADRLQQIYKGRKRRSDSPKTGRHSQDVNEKVIARKQPTTNESDSPKTGRRDSPKTGYEIKKKKLKKGLNKERGSVGTYSRLEDLPSAQTLNDKLLRRLLASNHWNDFQTRLQERYPEGLTDQDKMDLIQRVKEWYPTSKPNPERNWDGWGGVIHDAESFGKNFFKMLPQMLSHKTTVEDSIRKEPWYSEWEQQVIDAERRRQEGDDHITYDDEEGDEDEDDEPSPPVKPSVEQPSPSPPNDPAKCRNDWELGENEEIAAGVPDELEDNAERIERIEAVKQRIKEELAREGLPPLEEDQTT